MSIMTTTMNNTEHDTTSESNLTLNYKQNIQDDLNEIPIWPPLSHPNSSTSCKAETSLDALNKTIMDSRKLVINKGMFWEDSEVIKTKLKSQTHNINIHV